MFIAGRLPELLVALRGLFRGALIPLLPDEGEQSGDGWDGPLSLFGVHHDVRGIDKPDGLPWRGFCPSGAHRRGDVANVYLARP
jgi:hypothetical protein